MADEVKSHIEIADQLTKQGKRIEALALIEKIYLSKPGRVHLPALARLANRNSSYLLAMRILHSEFENERKGISEASPEDIVVYANSLLNIGSAYEAKKHLDRCKGHVEAKLIRAFVEFSQWNYSAAIPLLTDYVKSPKISAYQKAVGQVNLAASLISLGQYDKARNILAEATDVLSVSPNGQLLLGNSFELSSQIDLFQGQLTEAEKKLKRAQELLVKFPSRYLLYVKKWQSVLNALKQNSSKPSDLIDLQDVKDQALHLRNWETIRDCDFYLARFSNDENLMAKVYYGTPYASYRNRMENLFGVFPPKTDFYEFQPYFFLNHEILDEAKSDKAQLLDLSKVSNLGFLSSTSLALFQAVIEDAYRPPRGGFVFSRLYKGESFNPFTSPQRVRNAIFQFNLSARHQGQEIKIVVNRGHFFLISKNPITLRIKSRRRVIPKWQVELSIFKERWGLKSFTVSSLAKTLDISRSKALNLLKSAIDHKTIVSSGVGRGTQYHFSSHLKVKRNSSGSN